VSFNNKLYKELKAVNDILRGIFFLIIAIFISLAFLQCQVAKADPNLTIDAPSANCNCSDLPKEQNVKDLKAIFKQIRNHAAHPDSAFIHLHNKERNIIRKRLPEQPSLEVYLR
jgi:hypothetical protein